MKIGIPYSFFFNNIDLETEKALKVTMNTLRDLGSDLSGIHLSNMEGFLKPKKGTNTAPPKRKALHIILTRVKPADLF
ncbi:hypothetical protein EU245_07335 [Lentibacillus lipolyticus]|nr:hypothetical protein EU245_07335 [Lentibacillus lipolyticus]